MTMRTNSRLTNFVLPVLAISMLLVVLIPADLWHHPSYDAIYHGFDSNLVYANSEGSPGNAVANVSSDAILLESTPGSQPVVTLLTTPLSFQVRFAVSVQMTGQNATPLQVGIWSPEESAGYFVNFGGSNRTITTQAVVGGSPGTTLHGGQITKTQVLGSYFSSGKIIISIGVNRQSQLISSQIMNDPSTLTNLPINATSSITAQELPTLFRSVRLSLTLTADSQSGLTKILLSNYELALPSERWLAYTIDDPRAKLIVVSLLTAGGIACLIEFWTSTKDRVYKLLRSNLGRVQFSSMMNGRTLQRRAFMWTILGLFYVAGNSLFFTLGSAPFDILSEKLWSYLAATQSLTDLYHTPLVVTSAIAWNGIPHHELPFAYNYVLTYYFAMIGWTYRFLIGGSGQLLMNTFELEFLIKTFNAATMFIDGALSYSILMMSKVKNRTALIATCVFLLNPALWFVSSIWGTTEPITIFFILLSIWAAEKRNPVLAWVSVGLGALTRPQMLVPAIVLAAIYLRKFSPRINARAVCLTIITTFLLLAPFSLAVSPSLPIDYELQVYSFHVSQTGNEPGLSAVSGSAYNIWPIITGIFNGAQGNQRFWVPGTTQIYSWLDYAYLSAFLSLGLVALIVIIILRGPKSVADFSVYMPLLSLSMLGFLLLKTEIVSRYFFYGLSLVAITRRSLGRPLYYAIMSVLTTTTFVTVYASTIFAAQLASGPSAYLNPAIDVLSKAILFLYSQDWFISAGSLANLIATVALGVSGFKTLASKHQSQGAVVLDDNSSKL